MNDTILTEIRGRVLVITLNRPEARLKYQQPKADPPPQLQNQLHHNSFQIT
jgi:enoyl-CoA hydratase/carnithine racemase